MTPETRPRTEPPMLLDLIFFVFWLPIKAIQGLRRIWILHGALKAVPCPTSLAQTPVHVRMGTDAGEFGDCDDQDCGLGAWCAMVLFLRDPYLEIAETTWFKIVSVEGRCLVHARRFPDGRFEVLKRPA